MPLKNKTPPKKRITRNRPKQQSVPYDVCLGVMEDISAMTGYVWSQREIADVCGITQGRVQQIEAEGLRNLRAGLKPVIAELQLVFPHIA